MARFKLIAIDPSTTALGLFNGVDAKTFEVQGKKASRPERLAFMAERLAEELEEGNYDFLVYEEQFVRGGAATKALFGVVGVIECLSHTYGIGSMSVPQAKLRAWARQKLLDAKVEVPTGFKGWEKVLMRTVALTMLGRQVNQFTEHECDAACLYYYVKEINNGRK